MAKAILARPRTALLLAGLLFPLLAAAPVAVENNNLPSVLNGVGIDQKLGAQVPGDLVFRDEAGASVRLSSYFGKRPVVLAMVYYKCPMLCTMELDDLVRAMNVMPLGVGDDYDVVAVSFDPTETPEIAAAKKRDYVRQYRGPAPGSTPAAAATQGWHFLTGSQQSIQSLADSVGFHFTYDPKFGQFVHAAGIMVLTPDGHVSRYFFGIDYAPKDLRLSLVEASGDKIGTLTDTILLFCYHYDPSTKRYSLAVVNLLKVAAALTLLVLGSFLFISFRREKQKAAAPGSRAPVPRSEGGGEGLGPMPGSSPNAPPPPSPASTGAGEPDGDA